MKILIFGVILSVLCITEGNDKTLDLLKMIIDHTNNILGRSSRQRSFARVSCTCNGSSIEEDVSDALKAANLRKDFLNEYCEKRNSDVCVFSTKCDNCTLEMTNCSDLFHSKTVHCFYRNIKVQREGKLISKTGVTSNGRKIMVYPSDPLYKTQISIPSTDIAKLLLRRRRNVYEGACLFPSEMRTAELKCHIYPKSVKCRQTCVYGYTLPEGISKEMVCYYKDNKWSGQGFRECVPFVDCTVTLASGGKVSCEKNRINKASICDVSCEPYEDKPAVPTKSYTCTLEPHKWIPDLPHCAISGSGFILAPAPRIKDPTKPVVEPEPEPKKKPKRANLFAEPDFEQAYETHWE